MKPIFLTSIALFAGLSTTAFAGNEASLTYEQFEVAVPHFDLENCPETLAADNRFCRATFHNEEIHVFAFSEDGDSPLVGFASYASDGLGGLLK